MGIFGLLPFENYFVFFAFPFFFLVFCPATIAISNQLFSSISIKNFLFAHNLELFLENTFRFD